jgi:hypothetical protein
VLILCAGVVLFRVPVIGNLMILAALTTLFISTNLSVDYTFSTLAQNQPHAVQMTMMFFLPNILLSGFAFPFAGMPQWARWIGECLPLTHFIRVVRSILLKGSTLGDLQTDTIWLVALMLVAMTIAVTLFRRTLDWRRPPRWRARLVMACLSGLPRACLIQGAGQVLTCHPGAERIRLAWSRSFAFWILMPFAPIVVGKASINTIRTGTL